MMRGIRWAAGLATAWALEAGATALNQVALQDLNGLGDNVVQNQTNVRVRIRSSSESSVYNRKAMFLFDLKSFAGRDLTDQYIHSATFRLVANERCSNRLFRLYGFTDTSGGNDSSWHEGIEEQSAPGWPVVYAGRNQYPSGNGVRWLDTRAGPGVGVSVTFSSNLLSYARWAVGRQPAFGHSPANPDGRITLLLAMQNHVSQSSYYYSRESSISGYRPLLTLDVRFPVLGMTLAGGAVTNQGLYDFGVFEDLSSEVSREWVLHNHAGEALSSLHVTGINLEGAHAWVYGLTLPDGEDFYLNQGETTSGYAVRFDPDGAYGTFDDARVVVASNDPDAPVFTVHLRAVHQAAPPEVVITDPPANTNVLHEVDEYELRGTASHVVGWMSWSNSLGGSGGFAAPVPGAEWRVTVPLAVGENVLTVSGTNVSGASAQANVTLFRERDDPEIHVENPAGWFLAVSNAAGVHRFEGTANRHVAGEMHWSVGRETGGSFPAATNWSVEIPLADGWNDWRIVASNATGATVSAEGIIVRQPAAELTPGDVVVAGWLKRPGGGVGQSPGSALLLGTLAPVPAGTVIYLTDNGASSNGWFFGASEEQAAGFEHVCALVFRETVGTGQLIHSHQPDPRWTWVMSGRIATSSPDEYSLLQLGHWDQVYAFQSDGPNPLHRPARHLFVLDDTDGFEEPMDDQTGNVPPGLVEGETALTFAFPFQPERLHYDFEAFPDWMRTRPQWIEALADPDQWQHGLLGGLPGGRFLVGELALLEVTRTKEETHVSFSCAYPGRDYVLRSATNLLTGFHQEEATGIVTPGRITETLPPTGPPMRCFRVELPDGPH